MFLNEDIGDFNYNKTFIPPTDVVNTCKNAIKKYNSTLKKAIELSQGQSQTFQQMKKLRDFFSSNDGVLTDEIAKKNWELHGGEATKKWVERSLSNFHDENLRTKKNLRQAGGAGNKKGMGIFDTGLMDTRKGRYNIR